MEPALNEKQALAVAIAILNKEKTLKDYGHQTIYDAKKQLEGRLFNLEETEKMNQPVKKRPQMCNSPATPEVYDKFYPKFWSQALPVNRKNAKKS